MRLSSRFALAALLCGNLAAASSNSTSLRGSAIDGRRLATRVAVPGTITAMNYVSYIDTPGVAPGFAVTGGIGYIYRGEQASYQISVATAGTYSVAYSFASSVASTVQTYLVKGTNCYGTRIGGYYQENFKTAGWATYVYKTSSKQFSLAKGDQTVTVCFLRGNMNFGGIKLAKTSGQPAAPAPTPTYPVADSSNCYSSAVWESSHGEVRLNGKPFHIKGASWSGFETSLYNLHGLWTNGVSVSSVLDILVSQKVNVLRLPMSLALALNPSLVIGGYCGSCVSTNAWDQLGAVIDEAAKKGIFVLLDMHNLAPDSNAASQVWYNSVYSEADFIKGWTNIVGKFKTKPNVFGLDLFNEPHGISSWGIPTKTATDWGAAAGRIITAINAAHPDYKGLFFVEGGQNNANTVYPKASQYEHWWGGNLDAIYNYPVAPTGANAGALYNRLVYSPHVYGPDVWGKQSYFLDPTFPVNMPDVWNVQLGHVERVSSGRAAVIGEWGGSYTGKDKILQDALVLWLKQKCMADAIFWVVNPDSGDTGGLLGDDWATINAAKFGVMATLQPNPSKMGAMALTNTKFCVSSWGAYGNPACASTIG